MDEENGINVYEFMTKYTIDVDIMEKRTGMIVKQPMRSDFGELVARETDGSCYGPLASSLCHRIFPVEWDEITWDKSVGEDLDDAEDDGGEEENDGEASEGDDD
jgi:hypothetical protein